MSDSRERFVRWQAYTTAQMSVVVALLGALSLAGLGFSVSLAQDQAFKPVGSHAVAFLAASLLFFLATLFSVGANLTRLIDFRLTAAKVRAGSTAVPPTFLGAGVKCYSKATWFLVWSTVLSLLFAVIFLGCGVLPGIFSRVLSGAGF